MSRMGTRLLFSSSTCSSSPTKEGRKKKAMLATRKWDTVSMCRSLSTPVSSRTISSTILMTLAGKATGSSAATPSPTRQMPKIRASSPMMFIGCTLSLFRLAPVGASSRDVGRGGGRTKGPLVKGGCRRRQAVTGGFRITKTFRFTESPRHFVALPPLTRGALKVSLPEGGRLPLSRGDVEHSETEGIGKWPKAVEEKSPQGSVRKQAAKTALLAFPPQGGRWPEGPDEGADRGAPLKRTLISQPSADSFPLGGGSLIAGSGG